MITIQDPGQTLSPTQLDALHAKANAYPFDIHVLIGAGSSSRGAFESQVAGFVAPGSRTVSIGVDPSHHFTFVRSSAALGVPPGPQVAQAGNAFFKSGNLVDGIDAIAAKANELRVEPVAPRPFVATHDQRVIQSQTGVPIIIQENHTAAGVWWGVGAFVAVAAAFVFYAVWRARKARAAARAAEETYTLEAAELAANNVEHMTLPTPKRAAFTPPSYPAAPSYRPMPVAAPAPVVVVQQPQQSHGLDLLLGYELGRSNSAPRVIERETVIERESSSSFWSGSGSDSSSSSDWSGSSDSSSSSSFDFGSSDSSSGSDW